MTKETVDKAVELFTDGYSAKEIGGLLGYSETAVAYNLKAKLVSSRHDIINVWEKRTQEAEGHHRRPERKARLDPLRRGDRIRRPDSRGDVSHHDCRDKGIEEATKSTIRKTKMIASSSQTKLENILSINCSYGLVRFEEEDNYSIIQANRCMETTSRMDINPADKKLNDRVTLTGEIDE